MTSYENFYQPSPYSLEPSYGEFIGYRVPVSELGAPTKPDTAAQIVEVGNMLNQGLKHLEVGALSPEVFTQIPKDHFKEINRISKLTGAETSVHAPMVEPAGFTKEGWSEESREMSEREILDVIEKSHALDPNGNVPVTIHASGIPGPEYSKPTEETIKVFKDQIRRLAKREPTREEMEELAMSKMIAINQETNQLIPIAREDKYYPEIGHVVNTAEKEIDTVNNTEWTNSMTNLAFYKKEADEIMEKGIPALYALHEKVIKGEEIKGITPTEKEALKQVQRSKLFLDNVQASFRTAYNKAYKYSDEDGRKELEKIKNVWMKESAEMRELAIKAHKEHDPMANAEFIRKESQLLDKALHGDLENPDPEKRMVGLENIPTPEVYKPIEEFAVKKSAKTLSNAAFESYKKFGSNAPIISVENFLPGTAFARSDKLKELVQETRNEFIEKLRIAGHSADEAKRIASKHVGVTWDVGHLNILKKHGFTDKELIEETRKISPYVKHVHITDNFGFSDSHLPPGMGNVPMKEHLQTLDKVGFKGKKVVEAGAFVQHFRISPYPAMLEAFGSPLYGMAGNQYWNQGVGFRQGYFGGYGTMLPEQHFSMYGAGFAGLPQELGGQIPGKQSRVSGTPMD